MRTQSLWGKKWEKKLIFLRIYPPLNICKIWWGRVDRTTRWPRDELTGDELTVRRVDQRRLWPGTSWPKTSWPGIFYDLHPLLTACKCVTALDMLSVYTGPRRLFNSISHLCIPLHSAVLHFRLLWYNLSTFCSTHVSLIGSARSHFPMSTLHS